MPLAPFYLIALTFIGIADTLYLSYSKFINVAPSCILEGCDVVLASPYAEFLGIPLAYWGLVYYVYMLGLVFLLAFDPHSRAVKVGMLTYTAFGLLCSIAFIYIQGAIIGAFCQYCVLSAAVTAGLFALTLWHFKSAKA